MLSIIVAPYIGVINTWEELDFGVLVFFPAKNIIKWTGVNGLKKCTGGVSSFLSFDIDILSDSFSLY